jgi:hypothetical protein
MTDLFVQLGLPSTPDAIEGFLTQHKPLPAGMEVCDAPFWTRAQADFLCENMRADADWSILVDALSLALRES